MDANQGEPRVLISRAAILHNTTIIRRALGERTRICAILKADAYGHNSKIVADTLCNFSADGSNGPPIDAIGVFTIDEAIALPETHDLPVIILRPVECVFIGQQREKLEEAIAADWVLTVCSESGAEDVARIAMAMQKRAQVQVMIDTGLTRSGVPLERLNNVLHRIQSRPSLRLAGLCTHFANGDRPGDPFTIEQLSRFREATDPLAAAMQGKFLRHAASSGTLFTTPESHLDMVRPGISLYGIDPSGRINSNRALRPAMKWVAPLLAIKRVAKGTSVGYGQTWLAPRETRIGLVPVGYADGYPRSFGNKAQVRLGDRLLPVVGRVSMDMITIDLSDAPASIGEDVVLMDSDPISPVSVYQLARWAETIPYEIIACIGQRMTRVPVEARESVTH